MIIFSLLIIIFVFVVGLLFKKMVETLFLWWVQVHNYLLALHKSFPFCLSVCLSLSPPPSFFPSLSYGKQSFENGIVKLKMQVCVCVCV